MRETNKSLVWVIDGSLSEQLHRMARLSPASFLCNLGWDVTMITAGVPQQEVEARIKFIVLPWPRIYLLGALIYYLSVLLILLSGRTRPHVLMFQTDNAVFILPIALCCKVMSLQSMKIVMDTRSMPMDTATVRGRLRALSFNLSHCMARCAADGQTAITEEMVRTVGISKKQLLGIWPSGVNVDEFAVSLAHRQWPDADEAVNFTYIGALSRERNLTAVLDAICLARKKGLNVNFEAVGDGPQRRELEEYALAKGDGTVKVSPPVPHEAVPGILARGHVGLLPFPDLPKMRVSSFIKLFEYMAAGMPIVATRIVAHTNVLDGVEFVFWADDATPKSIASAIDKACFRKREFPQLGIQAHAFAQNWTWEASAKSLSEALLKAVSSPRKTPINRSENEQ